MAGQSLSVAQAPTAQTAAPATTSPKGGRQDALDDATQGFSNFLQQGGSEEQAPTPGPLTADGTATIATGQTALPLPTAAQASQQILANLPASFKAALALAQQLPAETGQTQAVTGTATGTQTKSAAKATPGSSTNAPSETNPKDGTSADNASAEADVSAQVALANLNAMATQPSQVLTPPQNGFVKGAMKHTPPSGTTTPISQGQGKSAEKTALLNRLAPFSTPQDAASTGTSGKTSATSGKSSNGKGGDASSAATTQASATAALTATIQADVTANTQPQNNAATLPGLPTNTQQQASVAIASALPQTTDIPATAPIVTPIKVLQQATYFAPDAQSKVAAQLNSNLSNVSTAATNASATTVAANGALNAQGKAAPTSGRAGPNQTASAQLTSAQDGAGDTSTDSALAILTQANASANTTQPNTPVLPTAQQTGRGTPAQTGQQNTANLNATTTDALNNSGTQRSLNFTSASTSSQGTSANASGENGGSSFDAALSGQGKQQAVNAPITTATGQAQIPTTGFSAPARQVASQIIQTLTPTTATPAETTTASGPIKTLSIELQPAQLGTVVVDMSIKDGTLALRVQSANPETAHMLQQDQQSLTNILKDAGYKVDNLSIQTAAQTVTAATSSSSSQSFSSGSQQQSSSQNQGFSFAQSGQSGGQGQGGQGQGNNGRQPQASQSSDQDATLFGGTGQTRDDKVSGSPRSGNLYI